MTQVSDLVVYLLPLARGGLAAAQLLLLLLLRLLLRSLILAAQRVGGVVTAGCARVCRMLRSKQEKLRYRKGRLTVKLIDTVVTDYKVMNKCSVSKF